MILRAGLSALVMLSALVAHADGNAWLNPTYETNPDYSTLGVGVEFQGDITDEALAHFAVRTVQRLEKGDGNRSHNATFELETGAGFRVSFENESNPLNDIVYGALIRYDFDSLLSTEEKEAGKKMYNRAGLKPGLFVMKGFGKRKNYRIRVAAVHDGKSQEYQVEISRSLSAY